MFGGSNLFYGGAAACGISVPRPGIELVPRAVEAWSLNHCTAREVSQIFI